MTGTRPRLHICRTCRAGRDLEAGEAPPGARLHDAIARLLDASGAAAPVTLHGVECLASCARGCTAAISMPGKWSYLLGHLRPGVERDLLAYGAAYAASRTGTVLPSRRPASLNDMILGRFPACTETTA